MAASPGSPSADTAPMEFGSWGSWGAEAATKSPPPVRREHPDDFRADGLSALGAGQEADEEGLLFVEVEGGAGAAALSRINLAARDYSERLQLSPVRCWVAPTPLMSYPLPAASSRGHQAVMKLAQRGQSELGACK